MNIALDDAGPRPMTDTESVAVLVRAVVRAAELWKLSIPKRPLCSMCRRRLGDA